MSEFFPPIVTANSNDQVTYEVSFTFNDTMQSYNFTSKDISVAFTGPSSYSVSWSANYTSTSKILKLSYSVSPAIVGGVGEQLSVRFINVKAFKSAKQIPMTSVQEYWYTFDEVEPSEQTEKTGKSTSYTFIATICVSVGISLLTGGSMELMWSLANTLQIVYI